MKKHYFFSLLMTAGAHVALAQSPDLEAYISFNGSTTAINAGNVLSVSTAGINSGAVLTTDRNGNPNSAVNLNGSAFIDFGDHPNFRFGMDDFTVALWMRGDATQVGQGIPIGKRGFVGAGDRAYMFGWTASTNELLTYYRDNQGFANIWPDAIVSANEWHHIAMVFDRVSAEVKTYVDGVLQGNEALDNVGSIDATGTTAGQLMVGRSSNSGQFFKGDIDEVYVIRRALTESQIASLIDPSLCIVNIPDANFKAALVGNNSINTNQDAEIQCDEAAAFTGYLGLNALGISDLTGLEAFTAATQLDISGNNISPFDITPNVSLTYFNCGFNGFTGTLTFDAANSALINVFVDGNQLTGVDVSALPNLRHLDCAYNNITSLDLSSNTDLRILAADGNALAALDLSNNLEFTDLSLTANGIVSLDVSANSNLVTINVQGNVPMVYLNVANGNNTNFTYYSSFNNPNLGCIQVDNVAYSVANWTNVHPFSSFNTFCTPPITVGLDEQETTTLSIYPNPTTGILMLSQTESGQVMDMSGRSLMSFSNARTIDLSNLASGTYMVRTVDGGVMRVLRE